MTPMPAPRALDMFFLEARSKLLDVAATLDRLDRGTGSTTADSRVEKIRQALLTLLETEPGRAERVQRIFSLNYDPDWPVPQPRL
ncbi:MAG TPA: hypothetical protein VHR66_27890 [Gemmataceae bacterium]|jgi:hypothetical protein|nr:hypothetical protein [Gemmataceae bacterium]